MVASVVGATGNNELGVCGVNWTVGLIPLQVYQVNTSRDIISEMTERAINYATESYADTAHSIKILNISLDNLGSRESLYNAIQGYPGLIVCSAGNTNKNIDLFPTYPEHYGSEEFDGVSLENIIVVGALQMDGNRWYEDPSCGSNYGENTVDIYAPGCDIIVLSPEEQYNSALDFTCGYSVRTGTSFAAPYVSGVAALLLSINPDLTTAEIKNCILYGAENIDITIGENNDQQTTVKMLNAWGSFKYLMDNYYGAHTHQIGMSSIYFVDYIVDKSKYSKFSENTSFVKLNITSIGDCVFDISSNKAIKSTLYDSNYDIIMDRETNFVTGNELHFTKYLTPGTYYLKTNIIEEISCEEDIEITIHQLLHTHVYTTHERYSSTHHIEACECGAIGTVTGPHVISAAEAGLRMAFCMLCGQRVLVDNTIIQVPGTNNLITMPRSANGSYILPNGIIVLVDEDVEAYFAGTLVFYEGENVPVTE